MSKEQSDFDPVQLIKSHNKSLYVHCGDYIERLNLTIQERLVAYKFLEELEATGWICVSVQDVAKETSTNVEIVQTVLESLQQIEPAGLFARTLSECLTLQAAELGLLDGTLQSILENLHLLGGGKFDLLKRRCGCTDQELSDTEVTFKSLNPKPKIKMVMRGSKAVPDLKITKNDDGWLVTLNKSTLPSVVIDKSYAKTS